MRATDMWSAEQILKILDDCCRAFTFPMLDNGYVYVAASRLSVHRSDDDWALVIEVFGFSPRAGLPDVQVYTFGSRLKNRDNTADYGTREAYEQYLAANPNNEARFFRPIAEGDWQDSETCEFIAPGASTIPVRGVAVPIPAPSMFERHGIELEQAPRIQTFELCRALAAEHREQVLGTAEERRVSVPDELHELLVLNEWNHPDVVNDERPSESETFQMLAEVMVSGEVRAYRPSAPANTHWSNWPDGGTL